jgi:DNA-binding transcriptional ArsR family regulator
MPTPGQWVWAEEQWVSGTGRGQSDLTAAQIAEAIGVSPATVGKHMRRCGLYRYKGAGERVPPTLGEIVAELERVHSWEDFEVVRSWLRATLSKLHANHTEGE